MSPGPSQAAIDLARQIRTELSEPAPQGFQYHERMLGQDESLQRLCQQLAADPNTQEVEQAVIQALNTEQDGWVLLKLVELADRLQIAAVAAALLRVAREPPGEGERSMFLAGRACEVLLKLPLDLKTRAEANQVCSVPLERVTQFRLGAQTERLLQRPRRLEWILLATLMALGLGGFAYALLSARAH